MKQKLILEFVQNEDFPDKDFNKVKDEISALEVLSKHVGNADRLEVFLQSTSAVSGTFNLKGEIVHVEV